MRPVRSVVTSFAVIAACGAGCCRGAGVTSEPGEIEWTPFALDFTTSPGTSATGTVTLSVASGSTVQVTGVSINGDARGVFHVPNAGFAIPGGGDTALTVTYAPPSSGNDAAQLELQTDSSNTPVIDIPLDGICGASAASGTTGTSSTASSGTTTSTGLGSAGTTGGGPGPTTTSGASSGTSGRGASTTTSGGGTTSCFFDAPPTPASVTVLAGAGGYDQGGTRGDVDGSGSGAELDGPTDIATDGTNLYVIDGLNYAIRKIDAQGNVTTLYGNGTPEGAPVGLPTSIAADSAGDLFFVVWGGLGGGDILDELSAGATTPTALLTTATTPLMTEGTPDVLSSIAYANGSLYLADRSTCDVEVVSTAGAVGAPIGGGCANGPFSEVTGVGADAAGTIYLGDDMGALWKVSGGAISSLGDYGGGGTNPEVFKLAADSSGHVFAAFSAGYSFAEIGEPLFLDTQSCSIFSFASVAITSAGAIDVVDNADDVILTFTP